MRTVTVVSLCLLIASAALAGGCADTDKLLGGGGAGAFASEGGSTEDGVRPPEGGAGGTASGLGGQGGAATCEAAEVCGDSVDNDCNGSIDDGCECTPGDTQACYSGAQEVAGVGDCVVGVQTCDETGKWTPICDGEVLPSEEVCDGADNDCDGAVDQGFEPVTCGQGVCQVTVNECQDGVPQICEPLDPEGSETCDGVDDDCDGSVDEGCACTNGQTQACYSGAMGTLGVGPCVAGTQTCVGGQWAACMGQVLPQSEICDAVDQDCDNNVSEGSCSLPNAVSACGAGTCTISSCTPGFSHCDASQPNGCETNHTGHSNSAPGQDLGNFASDSYYGTFCTSGGNCAGPITTQTGKRGRYFHIDAEEASSCCSYVSMRVELMVPPGSDYDLYISGNGCFADPGFQSLNGTGANEVITIWCDDDCGGADNGFGVDIEVRYYSGASCDPWTLNVYNRAC